MSTRKPRLFESRTISRNDIADSIFKRQRVQKGVSMPLTLSKGIRSPVLATSMVSLLAFAGCSLEHSSEKVSICKVVDQQGWLIEKDWPTSAKLEESGITYSFDVQDDESGGKKRGSAPSAFWIKVTGMTIGSANPKLRRPFVYDPTEAVLEIEGKRVSAIPKIWFSEQVNGIYQPVSETPIPTDLNIEYQRLTASFFIGFPIPPPTAKQTYKFHPGTALLDGKRVNLPSFGSCYFPFKVWLYPVT